MFFNIIFSSINCLHGWKPYIDTSTWNVLSKVFFMFSFRKYIVWGNVEIYENINNPAGFFLGWIHWNIKVSQYKTLVLYFLSKLLPFFSRKCSLRRDITVFRSDFLGIETCQTSYKLDASFSRHYSTPPGKHAMILGTNLSYVTRKDKPNKVESRFRPISKFVYIFSKPIRMHKYWLVPVKGIIICHFTRSNRNLGILVCK